MRSRGEWYFDETNPINPIGCLAELIDWPAKLAKPQLFSPATARFCYPLNILVIERDLSSPNLPTGVRHVPRGETSDMSNDHDSADTSQTPHSADTSQTPPTGGPAVATASNQGKRAGYKRPPKATQFKPGQSGNPSGRRRGSRNLRTDLVEILNGEVVAVSEDGHERTLSRQEVVLLTLFDKAKQGNVGAIMALLNMAAKFVETAEAPAANELSAGDQKILENFLRATGAVQAGAS